jgi:hypothetical protein
MRHRRRRGGGGAPVSISSRVGYTGLEERSGTVIIQIRGIDVVQSSPFRQNFNPRIMAQDNSYICDQDNLVSFLFHVFRYLYGAMYHPYKNEANYDPSCVWDTPGD